MTSYSRRDFAKALGLGATAIASSGWAPAARPNLVFILCDDLGWRDTSLYGSKFYETPNIDRLSTRGMLFRNAYAAAPICSPTRASIMTGLYPARLGITQPSCHLPQLILEQTLQAKAVPTQKALQANSVTRLKQEYFTLAEALKEAGYATGHFGKWHLGMEPYDPLHQGFDVDVPHYWGPGPAGSYVGPWKFPEKLNFVGKPGEHLEDRMASEGVKFIRANANKDRPFYLNYWCFSVHEPWNAKEDLIAKYRAKADPSNPQHNPVYAAMVESLDTAVGRLVATLDETGIAGNTIVVFFSDNGGVAWTPGNAARLRAAGGKKEARSNMQHPGYDELPITSNSPLRGGKGTIYEGGTREPCFVIWPRVTTPGSRSEQMLSSVDFYPTVLDMLGLKPKPDLKLDGRSFASALRGKPIDRGAIFCHYPHYSPLIGSVPSSYVHQGDWKLIRFYADSAKQTDRVELYNLRDDIGETNDLAAKTPAKVRELSALMDRFLRDTHATIPKPNPNYKPESGAGPRPAQGGQVVDLPHPPIELFTSDDMA